LFAGDERQTAQGDTWTWNGLGWARARPATSPPKREKHAMAFDAARGKVVLFGGSSSFATSQDLSDTWTWDGATWTQAAPSTSPPGRAYHAMVYDPVQRKVVLFGGSSSSNDFVSLLGDTWTWDGSAWTKAAPSASPPARAAHAMAYDRARSQIVLFGGEA